MAINWSKDLAQAYAEMAENKRNIENSTPSGTPSGKKSEWSRKSRKHKGKVS